MTTRKQISHMSKRRHRALVLDLAFAMLLVVLAVYCGWLYRDFAQDDAFITYRYARNIARGLGFVYNVGEPVLGTTTPLYTVILALLRWLTGQDIRLLSHLTSMFSLWLSSLLIYDLGKGNGRHLGAGVALLFLTNPFLLTSIGMETFLFLAVQLLALKAFTDERYLLAGTLLGLIVLTRYEAVLFVGMLGVYYLVRYRRIPTWLLPGVALILPWFLYAWSTFGSVLPQSALSKLGAQDAGYGVSFARGAVIWWGGYGSLSTWYFALSPLVLVGAYSLLRDRRCNLAYWLVLAWSGIYFAAASLTAGSFSWYYGPLIPSFCILLAWGCDFMSGFPEATLARVRSVPLLGQTVRKGTFAVFVLGLVILQVSSWSNNILQYEDQIVDGRSIRLREVIEWLNQEASSDESLAAGEIGVVGYYTDMRIIDLHALVTPELQPWIQLDPAEKLGKAVELLEPDYIINFKHKEYEPVQSFHDGANVLYKRKQH